MSEWVPAWPDRLHPIELTTSTITFSLPNLFLDPPIATHKTPRNLSLKS